MWSRSTLTFVPPTPSPRFSFFRKIGKPENRKSGKSEKVEKWSERNFEKSGEVVDQESGKSGISIIQDFGGRKGGILEIGPVRQKLPYSAIPY